MAEGKKSFILYADLLQTAKKLPKDKLGELFLTILEYVNDLNPNPEDILIQVAFEPIKLQLKRDLVRYEVKKERYSESGRAGGIKSGEARRSKMKQNEATLQNASKNEANEAVTVNDTVTVNDINTKVFNNTSFFDLNENELNQAFEFVFRLGKKDILKDDIPNFWEAFKLHKPEAIKEQRGKQMQHFRDWLKFQKKDNGTTKTKLGTSAARVAGLKALQ